MNKYLKDFLKRGMAFGGFGPVIAGIVYLILDNTIENFSISGTEVFVAIISTYLLGFIHAGSSVFHQIEHWGPIKALLFQFGALYAVYTICYLINSWIPFDLKVLLIYTAIFVAGYFSIAGVIYICINASRKKLNSKLG